MVETITVDDLLRQLAQCLGVDGRANLAACVACRDEESLYEFLTAPASPRG